ncbi:MAG: peptidoglycan-binding domain-containing protein [Pseudomonadota bacterium]
MNTQKFMNSAVALAAATSIAFAFPVQEARANDAAKILGGVAAGIIIGNAARNSQARSSTTRSTQSSSARTAPRPWSAERQQRASVQQALNGMGYNVGEADGLYGQKTAAGMRNFQAAMGYPITGSLNPFEEQALLGAHASFTQGTHHGRYPGLFEREGMPGLVRAHADPSYYDRFARNAGVGPYAAHGGTGLHGGTGAGAVGGTLAGAYGAHGGTVGGQVPQHNGTVGHGVTHDGSGTIVRNMPEQTPPAISTGQGQIASLAPIERIGEVTVSMEEHCDFVKLSTQTNGGQILANAMTDPDQALGEQFCDARTYLMGQVSSTLSVARASEEELMASCETISSAMDPLRGTLAGKSLDGVIAEASGVSGSFGLTDPAAASEYGAVCIGLGYRNNDPDVALSGALMLVGAGRLPFAEMVAHHAREGFGTPENNEVAMSWYAVGLESIGRNEAPAVLPSQSIQRTAIISAAVSMVNQRAQSGAAPTVVPVVNRQLAPLNLGAN